jgi:hypothetical protein
MSPQKFVQAYPFFAGADLGRRDRFILRGNCSFAARQVNRSPHLIFRWRPVIAID